MAAEKNTFDVDHLFSLLPVAALIVDADTGSIIEVNDQSELLFGLPRTEIIGKTPAYLSPDYQPDGHRSEDVVKDKIVNVARRGGETFFWWHKHSSGTLIPCLVQTSKLPLLGSNLFIGFVTEITKQKEVLRGLLNFRHIFEQIDNPIAVVDSDYVYREVNPAYLELFKKTYEDIVGQRIPDILGKHTFETIAKEKYDRCFSGEKVRFQTWYETPEVGRRLFDIQYFPHYDANQEIDAAISCVRDITEIAFAQNSLSQTSKLDQILIDISSSFIDASIDNVDEKINDALKKIGEFLVLDRCSIGYLSEDKKEMCVSHAWNKFTIANAKQSYQLRDYPWLLSPFKTGEPLVWHLSKGMPDGSESDLELLANSGMKGFAGIPVGIDGKLVCCLGFSRVSCQDDWDLMTIDRFPLIAGLFGQLMQRKRSDLTIHNALNEIRDLKNELEKDNISLREKLKQFTDQVEIIGESDVLQSCLHDAEHVASENTTVLILGETGTGKELLAQVIHNMSPRKDRPMVKVNCAALPSNLIESELFGRERGAYTGAMAQQQGRFEIADGSTIFLDEIGDLPLDLQAKLLRVLQEGKFERLGSNKTIKVNVRIIAATNRNLSNAMKEGTFRKDLFYRLNVFPITLPPLSDRREDIPLLIWKFIEHFNRSMGKSVKRIPDAELERLKHADWPGNIRELKNIIERSMIISQGSELTVRYAGRQSEQTAEISDDIATLSDVERNHIIKTLEATHWRVSGEMGAAKILNIKPTTLEARMKKLGIVRPPK